MLANLNILDNILLPAVQANRSRGVRKRAPGKSAGELAQEARALMEKLGLSGLEERRITQVSGGQLQRACICRSMMNSPEILFADEPTGALNQSAAKEVMEELTKLNREGTAILMVTHDSKVAGCCERILYLLDGRIRGELRLGKMMAGADNRNPGKSAAGAGTLNPGGEEFWAEKQREKKVKEWLSRMGW